MRGRLACFIVLAATPVPGFGQQAVELQRVRGNYDSAVQRAVRPIAEAYSKELSRLRETYMRANRLTDAVQVDDELKAVSQKLATMAGAAPSTTGHRSVVLDTRAIIPANTAEGFKIGSVRQGDVITLQYVEGLWKAHGNIPTENPDGPIKNDDDRLCIARGPARGKPGDVLAIVPAGTAINPFTFTVPTTRDDVVLRIHKNSDDRKNPGAVTYQVRILR